MKTVQEAMSSETIILYNYFRSSSSYRVRLGLNFKGITFHYHPVNLLKGEQKLEAFTRMNPLGQVPVLKIGPRIICQSMAILFYLDELKPNPPLFEKDSRVKIIEFCEIINTTQPLHNLTLLKHLESLGGERAKAIWLEEVLNRSWMAVEQFLEKHAGEFCFGNSPTACDCFFLPHVFTSQRYNIDISCYPNAQRILQRLNLEEWALAAHPLRQIDAPSS